LGEPLHNDSRSELSLRFVQQMHNKNKNAVGHRREVHRAEENAVDPSRQRSKNKVRQNKKGGLTLIQS